MTEFLIGGCGTGKSHEAIKWVRGAGNRYLVVTSTMPPVYTKRCTTAARGC